MKPHPRIRKTVKWGGLPLAGLFLLVLLGSDPLDGGWLAVPCWLGAALAGLSAATAWRLDILERRRAERHLCPCCRYDRSGLAAGAVCPECGAGAPGGAARQ